MKTKLDIAREEINQIDLEMIELFKKRMNAVSDVVSYKILNNLPVLDASREGALIEKNLKALNDKSLEEYYLTFFEGVLKSSKDYQKKIKGE
jgi:chorismate mutase / prephenate dehydratase